ncbi:MAG: hypothetical protein AAF349_14220 [Cyanobacteria bacterium P01_A01_bin.68]
MPIGAINVYRINYLIFSLFINVNPTLTIAANALRVAEHLKERLNASCKEFATIGKINSKKDN